MSSSPAAASSAAPSVDELETVLSAFQQELDSGMRFWLRHSHDTKHGGFYNCLTENGRVYDTTKYGWFQGRQVWTYAYLYRRTTQYHTPEVLSAAQRGVEFIREHLPMSKPDGSESKRCYFAVTEDGLPVKIQRKPFTECFYVMALAEMSRAANKPAYLEEAREVLAAILHWARVDNSELGMPQLSGNTAGVSQLAVPMMLLCIIDVVCDEDSALWDEYKTHAEWSVEQILLHAKGEHVLEVVKPDGTPLSGVAGRHLNPGHAIEAGWFLMNYWQKHAPTDQGLLQTAVEKFLISPFSYGWDEKYGGLFYFLDCAGFPPVYLEWDMKLWWPMCETLIACLMAYNYTGDTSHWTRFMKVYDYCFQHYPDHENGEWFGYLNRRGEISQTQKGGPYKGCFHTVRCWQMCIELLQGALQKLKRNN